MKFELGRMLMTPGVEALIASGQVNPGVLLSRHASGDWGNCDAEDKAANDEAVKDGSRILSAYKVGEVDVWIISEADRSATTLLLPEEY